MTIYNMFDEDVFDGMVKEGLRKAVLELREGYKVEDALRENTPSKESKIEQAPQEAG